jgi:hypothetical protein
MKPVHRQDGCAAGNVRVEAFDERLRKSGFPGAGGTSERDDNASANSAVAEFMSQLLECNHLVRQGCFLPKSKARITAGVCVEPIFALLRDRELSLCIHERALGKIAAVHSKIPALRRFAESPTGAPGVGAGQAWRAASVFETSLFFTGEPADDVRHQSPVERPSKKILREPVRADICRPSDRAAATMAANGKKRQVGAAMAACRKKPG